MSDFSLVNILSYTVDKSSVKLESYIKRGREYKNRDTSELRDLWLQQIRIFFLNSENLDIQKVSEDIEAELELRDEKAPYDQVEEDMERFFSRISNGLSVLTVDQQDAINEQIVDDLNSFLDKAKNIN